MTFSPFARRRREALKSHAGAAVEQACKFDRASEGTPSPEALETAVPWYDRAIPLLQELQDYDRLAMCLSRKGLAMHLAGKDLHEAFKLQDEAELLCRDHNIGIGIQASLATKAAILTAHRQLGSRVWHGQI